MRGREIKEEISKSLDSSRLQYPAEQLIYSKLSDINHTEGETRKPCGAADTKLRTGFRLSRHFNLCWTYNETFQPPFFCCGIEHSHFYSHSFQYQGLW